MVYFYVRPIMVIGNKIKEVTESKGMTVSEFARRINTSRENAYGIFKRESIDTKLLTRICEVLDHDFFQYFTPLKDEVGRLREEIDMFKKIFSMIEKK